MSKRCKGCKSEVKGVRKIDGKVYLQTHCIKCRRGKCGGK